MSDTPVLKIDYNELPVTDMDAAKAFYAKAFGWTFEDYGPGYAAFTNAGLDGGLRLEGKPFPTGALIILMADDLEAAERRVEAKLLRSPWSGPPRWARCFCGKAGAYRILR